MMRRTSYVTSRQLEVLASLAQREYWLVGEFASVLRVSSGIAMKAIVRLERKGLVSRSVDTMDQHCVIICITLCWYLCCALDC